MGAICLHRSPPSMDKCFNAILSPVKGLNVFSSMPEKASRAPNRPDQKRPKSKAPHVKRSDMENEPTLRRFSTNGNEPERMFNLSATFAKGDFATICLQATEHFIVVREMVTNSRTMNSSTSFTFRRKENLCGTSKIAKTMNDFYTSETLAENFAKKPEFKPSTPLLEMKI